MHLSLRQRRHAFLPPFKARYHTLANSLSPCVSCAAVSQKQTQDAAVASQSQRQNSLATSASINRSAASSTKSRSSFGDSARVHTHPQARSFTFKEVQKATRNFQPEGRLGEGGYGTVFKGCLPDGSHVAVKVLNDCGLQGEREWEVSSPIHAVKLPGERTRLACRRLLVLHR